jgi:TrmH family RNA methyltransferase
MSGEKGRILSDSLEDLPAAGRGSDLVRDLRRLAREPAERRRRSLFLAEGIHLAEEALRAPGRIRLVVVSPRITRASRGRALLDRLRRARVPVRRAGDRLLEGLCDTESHQGVILLAARPAWSVADLLAGGSAPLVLASCGVQDPGNLGALARVVEAAWGTGIVCSGSGADPWSPRALRASAGSLLRVPLMEIPDAAETLSRLRSLGLTLAGASPRAGRAYREARLSGPLALFVGGEGPGLVREMEEEMDLLVRIPMRKGVDSLNVAAAAAVLLFEIASRRAEDR